MNLYIRYHVLLLAVASPCCAPAPVRAQDDPAALIQRLRVYHLGQGPSLPDALWNWVNRSRTDPARRAEAARRLSDALQSDTPAEAKQLACRDLVLIAGEAQIPALLPLLRDESLGVYSLMVLARIPGPQVNQALRRALVSTRGATRQEIDETLGLRRDPRAIPLLAADLGSGDPAVAAAAAAGLAKMQTPESLALLLHAFSGAAGKRRIALGDAVLQGASRVAAAGDQTSALAAFRMVEHTAPTPVQSAAALRGLAQLEGSHALPEVIAALGEENTPRQRMAARLARKLPRATASLCAALPKLSENGQLLLLSALEERADPAAATAVLGLARGADTTVRLAVLRTLGAVGDARMVLPLLSAAVRPEEQDAARDSLAHLRDKAVDARLIASLQTGSTSERVEAITALGARHATVAGGALLHVARTSTGEVRDAALKVLQDTARPSDLPALVDALLAAHPGDRDTLIAAIAAIARRGSTETDRTAVLLTRLSAIKSPADRADLLAVLGQVGGSGALAALRGALQDTDSQVRLQALTALTEWPTSEPLDDLLNQARTAADPRTRSLALTGYLRMIPLQESPTADAPLARYHEAAPLVRSAGEKRVLLSGLAKLHSRGALSYAASFREDQAVRAEAETALIEIGQSTIGAFPDETRQALELVATGSGDDAIRQRAREILSLPARFGDFVMAWEVSPAYQQDDADYSKLFDVAFPPEIPGQEDTVPWRLMPVGTSADQPWLLDLLALWGGEQRVAYLRTAIWSDTARDLVLELGSDDGVKAWWNGKVVAADNVARAIAPGQEKVTVQAIAGWNRLLLKITQNNQGWGACARLAHPDGTPAAELRVSVPSAVG